jgi:DNA-binding NtrC family response regulator
MKIRVLLVDDEESFVESLAARLETRGLVVEKAYNGDDALDRLREDDYDVVVLDMMMPGKDGIDTLNDIKRIRPLVEVILLTGFGALEKAVESLQRGAFYYLMKPTDMKDLLENIVNAYKRKIEHEERIRRAEIKRIEALLRNDPID